MAVSTFVDLFAGIGGFRLAMEAHGGKCVFSSEWDKFAQLTYEANHGDKPAGDISLIPAEDIPDHDVLCAGFPCQPFSVGSGIDALGFDHHAGNAFFEIIRILMIKKPNVVFLENVANLREHDYGRTFKVITESLEALGYKLNIKIINASRALPQRRRRIFIVGFLDHSLDFQWPVFPRRTVLLKDLLQPTYNKRYILSDTLWDYYRDRRVMPGTFPYKLIDPVVEPRVIAQTLHAGYGKDAKRILIKRKTGNPRKLTPREAGRLQGYPDSFQIPVSDFQAYRQFGNSIALPIVTAIAEQIVLALGQKERATFR